MYLQIYLLTDLFNITIWFIQVEYVYSLANDVANL